MNDRILLVEDSHTQRQIIRRQLLRCQLEPVMARGGHQAIALARRLQPQAVLMDIDMPGLNGLDTCRMLKKSPRTRHIPVVFLSSCEREACRLRALMRGGVAYLTKPVTRHNLCKALDRVLSRGGQ